MKNKQIILTESQIKSFEKEIHETELKLNKELLVTPNFRRYDLISMHAVHLEYLYKIIKQGYIENE